MPISAPNSKRRGRGAAFVEMALTLPVVAALMYGTVQLGQMLYTYHFVALAASNAARYAMVRGSACTSFTAACPAAASDIQTYVQDMAPGAITGSSLTATTTWSPNNSPGSTVTVTVKYSYTMNVPGMSQSALTLESTSTQIISQ